MIVSLPSGFHSEVAALLHECLVSLSKYGGGINTYLFKLRNAVTSIVTVTSHDHSRFAYHFRYKERRSYRLTNRSWIVSKRTSSIARRRDLNLPAHVKISVQRAGMPGPIFSRMTCLTCFAKRFATSRFRKA